MKIAAAIAGILLLLCLGLFFSSHAMLLWSSAPKEKVGTLRCTYFTGFGTVERTFLYTEQGFLGRDTCPRFIVLNP